MRKIKIAKKDRYDVVADMRSAVWILQKEIEQKDRKYETLRKRASQHMVQLCKQDTTITELRQEVSRLQKIILQGENK